MKNQFEQLLEEIGKELKTTLSLDANQACSICLKENGIAVQLEQGVNSDELVMGTVIGTLSKGPYRDKVFKAALLINGAQQPGIKGTLAYGEHTEKLYLCDTVEMSYINATDLVARIKQFSRYAKVWQSSLSSDTIPDLHDLGIYNI
ncbi:MAG: CesT family type III secretion system chaperone [Victivallaceae bacterium]